LPVVPTSSPFSKELLMVTWQANPEAIKADKAELDLEAKAMFDAMGHRHPAGHTPDWNIQPEHNKDVFRAMVLKKYGIRP
jgi:hypothetical protein